MSDFTIVAAAQPWNYFYRKYQKFILKFILGNSSNCWGKGEADQWDLCRLPSPTGKFYQSFIINMDDNDFIHSWNLSRFAFIRFIKTFNIYKNAFLHNLFMSYVLKIKVTFGVVKWNTLCNKHELLCTKIFENICWVISTSYYFLCVGVVQSRSRIYSCFWISLEIRSHLI